MPINVRDAFYDYKTLKSFVLSGAFVKIFDLGFQNLLTTIELKQVSDTTCVYIHSEDTS